MNLPEKALKHSITYWQSANLHKKILCGSFALLLIFSFTPHSPAKWLSLFAVGMICLIGYLTWLFSVAKKLWSSPINKFIIITLNAGALFASNIVAKNLLATATGLPPNDFESTLKLLTVINVLLIWLLIGIGIIGLSGSYFHYRRHIEGKKHFTFETWQHGISALLAIAAIQYAIGSITTIFFNPNLIIFSIYKLDYFDGHLIIPQSLGGKVMIHQNNLVSIAKPNQYGQIDITVLRLPVKDSEH